MGRINFLFDLISFNTPLSKVVNLSGIFIFLWSIPQNLISYSPFQCVFKNFLFPLFFRSCPASGLFIGCNCPGCGLTRGMVKFLHGDIKGAVEMNIFTPILFFAMSIMLLKNLLMIISSRFQPLKTRK